MAVPTDGGKPREAADAAAALRALVDAARRAVGRRADREQLLRGRRHGEVRPDRLHLKGALRRPVLLVLAGRLSLRRLRVLCRVFVCLCSSVCVCGFVFVACVYVSLEFS